jgi:hypothetical protein
MYKILGADGQEYGPIEADGLRRWVAEGRANAETRVQLQGAAEWKKLSELPEFASALSGAATPPPFQGPAVGGTTPKTNSLAVAGLILGVLSLTCGLCCCQGFPFSISGLICSGLALAQIHKNPEHEQGRGIAIAGLAFSIVSLVLGVILFVVGAAFSSTADILRKIQNL